LAVSEKNSYRIRWGKKVDLLVPPDQPNGQKGNSRPEPKEKKRVILKKGTDKKREEEG